MQQLVDCTSWATSIYLVRSFPSSARPSREGSYLTPTCINYANDQLNPLIEKPKKVEFTKNLIAELRGGSLSATTIKLMQTLKINMLQVWFRILTSASPNVKTTSLPFKVSIQGLFLGMYFASSDVDQFQAEWHRSKYDLIDFKVVGYESVTVMKRRIISNHNYFVHCKLQLLPFFFSSTFFQDMDFSLRQLCQSRKQYPLLSHVKGICYGAPLTNAWPEMGISAAKRIKTRYFYCGSIFFCMMQWPYFLFVLLWQVCPSYSRIRSLLKDDKLNFPSAS